MRSQPAYGVLGHVCEQLGADTAEKEDSDIGVKSPEVGRQVAATDGDPFAHLLSAASEKLQNKHLQEKKKAIAFRN